MPELDRPEPSRRLRFWILVSFGTLFLAAGMVGVFALFIEAMSSSHSITSSDLYLHGIAREEGQLLVISCKDEIGEVTVRAGDTSDSPLAWRAKLREGMAASYELPLGQDGPSYDTEGHSLHDSNETFGLTRLDAASGADLLGIGNTFRPSEIENGTILTLEGKVENLAEWRRINECK